MKKRFLGCLAIAGLITAGLTVNTNAKTDAYVVKDAKANIVYQFDLETLKDSFLYYTEGMEAPFYEEFVKKVTECGGVYAYHDDTNKYVSFSTVSEAFLNAQDQGKPFALAEFTESSAATPYTGLPETIKNLKITNGQKTYEDIKSGNTTPEESEYLEVISIE